MGRSAGLETILSDFVILISKWAMIMQNPNEGIYMNRSAIDEPPRKNILDTGARVIK